MYIYIIESIFNKPTSPPHMLLSQIFSNAEPIPFLVSLHNILSHIEDTHPLDDMVYELQH